jgi:hypothetical protein
MSNGVFASQRNFNGHAVFALQSVAPSTINATLDAIEVPDTLASFVGPPITADLLRKEEDDALYASASGAVFTGYAFRRQFIGSSGVLGTQIGGGGSAPGTGITATLSKSEGDDTLFAAVAIEAEPDSLASLVTVSAPSSSITADAGITEGNDALSSAGSVATLANLAASEESDALSSDASAYAAAALSATEQNDALASQASLITFASLAAGEADDALGATVSTDETVDVSLTATLADDALTSDVSVYLVASAALSDADDSVAASGVVVVGADVSIQEGLDTLSSAAIGPFPIIIADLDQTEGDDAILALLASTFRVQRRSGFSPRDANTKRSRWLSD